MTNAPDITVIACTDLNGSLDEQHTYPHADYLLVQTIWGELAFQLEHREVTASDPAVFEAGVKSALAAYRNILVSDPSHWQFFDHLLQVEANGHLGSHVADALKACR